MALLTDAQVADELAIRDLTQRFTDAVNRSATAEMAALFAPDGRWEVPGVTDTVGHDAIAARLAGLLAQFSLLVQLLHSGVVMLDGDRATARWYLTEHARDADGGGALFIGYYDDDLVRQDGVWRFASRRFAFLYRGRDDLPGRSYPYAGRDAVAPASAGPAASTAPGGPGA
ncbi:MAG: nuclear transport factor 2 family protein [Actinomycetota bacterium]|jgi:uncharacterized protein (TIGR02246 family)|nr:nuclear transport factor 2 family protein [Actinomycetota bacterium]